MPGHSARMHSAALRAPADEVVFDLEGAVAPQTNDAARAQVLATLADPAWRAASGRAGRPRCRLRRQVGHPPGAGRAAQRRLRRRPRRVALGRRGHRRTRGGGHRRVGRRTGRERDGR
ncbi:MAG: aldolase/citrate lyase family protein [Sporichthyaceae bacterium]